MTCRHPTGDTHGSREKREATINVNGLPTRAVYLYNVCDTRLERLIAEVARQDTLDGLAYVQVLQLPSLRPVSGYGVKVLADDR